MFAAERRNLVGASRPSPCRRGTSARSRSLSWPMTMVTAIPAVKPVVMVYGTKRMMRAQLEQAHNHKQHAGDDASPPPGRRCRRSRQCRPRWSRTPPWVRRFARGEPPKQRDQEACDDGRVQGPAQGRRPKQSPARSKAAAPRWQPRCPIRCRLGKLASLSSSLLECLMMLNRYRFNFVALQRFSIPLRRISIASRAPPGGKSCTAKIA